MHLFCNDSGHTRNICKRTARAGMVDVPTESVCMCQTRSREGNACSDDTHGIIPALWHQADGHVRGTEGNVLHRAMFHGWCSMEEGQGYWGQATLYMTVMPIAARPFAG